MMVCCSQLLLAGCYVVEQVTPESVLYTLSSDYWTPTATEAASTKYQDHIFTGDTHLVP